MSKFFNGSADKQDVNNGNMNNFQNGGGFVSPSDMNMNQQPETFVYNSIPKDQMMNQNQQMNQGMQNGNYVNNQMMPQQQMMNQNQQMNQGMPMQGGMMPPQGVVVQQGGNPQSNQQMQQMSNNQQMIQQQGSQQMNVSQQNTQQQNSQVKQEEQERTVDEYGNPIVPKEMEFLEEDLQKNVKANLFATFGMFIGMLLSPGTTIVSNSRRFRDTGKALSVTFWITVVSLIICIASRAVFGSFKKSYNAVTGYGAIKFDPSSIFELSNYTEYLIIAIIVSVVAISITAVVYYASSFMKSKGVRLGTYFMVSNLALIPLIVGVLVLMPALSIFSSFLGVLGLIFAFIYTLFSFMIGMNDVVSFKNENGKIMYHSMNISFVILIVYLLITTLIKLNVITIITLGVM